MEGYITAVFDVIEAHIHRYNTLIYKGLAPGVLKLFTGFVGVWMLIQLLYKGCLKGDISIESTVKPLLVFTIVLAFLKDDGQLYWQWFYEPVYQTITALSQKVLTIGTNHAPIHAGLKGLLKAVEFEMGKVLQLGRAIIAGTSFYQLHTLFGGFILLILFTMIGFMFLAFALECIFQLVMITSIAPLLIACAAFSSTRHYTHAAFRTILSGALTLIFASAASGFTLSSMSDILQRYGVIENGVISLRAADFVFSAHYMAIIFLGLISLFALKRASTVAHMIAGTYTDTGTGAVVFAGTMAAVTSVFAKGKSSGLLSSPPPGLQALGIDDQNTTLQKLRGDDA